MPLSYCEDKLVVGTFYDGFLSSYIGKEEPILDFYEGFLTKVKKDTKVEENKVTEEIPTGITPEFSLTTGLPLPIQCVTCSKSFIPVNISYCTTTNEITYTHNSSVFCCKLCEDIYNKKQKEQEAQIQIKNWDKTFTWASPDWWNHPTDEEYDEEIEEEVETPVSPINHKDRLLVQCVEGRKIKRVSE